jgi:hypothetical protein
VGFPTILMGTSRSAHGGVQQAAGTPGPRFDKERGAHSSDFGQLGRCTARYIRALAPSLGTRPDAPSKLGDMALALHVVWLRRNLAAPCRLRPASNLVLDGIQCQMTDLLQMRWLGNFSRSLCILPPAGV